jgi:beta-xylosidase
MKWLNDWPVIGIDKDGDGKGEPVVVYKKPNIRKPRLVTTPVDSDEFNSSQLGLQWQWHSNPKPFWYFMTGHSLRLYSVQPTDSIKNLWDVSNLLLQKFPAEEFTVTTKLSFKPRLPGERVGLIVFGLDYACLALANKSDGIYLDYASCLQADKGKPEVSRLLMKTNGELYLRIKVEKGAVCSFSYSIDGLNYQSTDEHFTAKPGRWIGAKIGFFCLRNSKTNDAGWSDVDWFRVDKD